MSCDLEEIYAYGVWTHEVGDDEELVQCSSREEAEREYREQLDRLKRRYNLGFMDEDETTESMRRVFIYQLKMNRALREIKRAHIEEVERTPPACLCQDEARELVDRMNPALRKEVARLLRKEKR